MPDSRPAQEAVDLSHEPAIALGPLQLWPALRQARRDGQAQTLEPRVMQVLVVLAQAGGQVVSRQELVARCWAGRVVGDGAIHRVVSRIRQLAEGLGQGCFQVETIARVGYRLLPGPQAQVPPDPAPGAADAGAPMSADACAPVSADAGLPAPPGALPAAAATLPGRARGPLRRHWLFAMLATAGLAAGGTGLWARHGRTQPGDGAAAAGAGEREFGDLLRQARQLHGEYTWHRTQQAIALADRATRLHPDRAEAWGLLALARTGLLRMSLGPAEIARAEAEIQDAAARALGLVPGQPEAEIARLLVQPVQGHWAGREAEWRAALRRHPGQLDLGLALGALLADLGRWSDSLGLHQALVRHHPLSPMLARRITHDLWALDRVEEARANAARACELWPIDGGLWEVRFRLLALTGDPARALELVERDTRAPDRPGPVPRQLAASLGAALRADSPSLAQQARDALRAERRRGAVSTQSAVQFLAALGFHDDVFELLERYFFEADPADPAEPARRRPRVGTQLLFLPPLRPLWPDPRLQVLTARVGLVAHWRAGGRPPEGWPKA